HRRLGKVRRLSRRVPRRLWRMVRGVQEPTEFAEPGAAAAVAIASPPYMGAPQSAGTGNLRYGGVPPGPCKNLAGRGNAAAGRGSPDHRGIYPQVPEGYAGA